MLCKEPDNTDARRFEHLKAMDTAKRSGNAAFKAGELDEANLEYVLLRTLREPRRRG